MPTYIAQKAASYVAVMGADGKMILANAKIEQAPPVYQKALELITEEHVGKPTTGQRFSIAMQPGQKKEEVDILIASVPDGGLLDLVWSAHTCRG